MYPVSLVERGNTELHWFLSYNMCAQVHRWVERLWAMIGGCQGGRGAGITSKAHGSMLLVFTANMSRNNSAVDVCSIFLMHHFSDCL